MTIMKLKNRIMSWLLSPGAYMTWHALGSPEEWEFRDGGVARGTIRHKPTQIDFWVANGRWFFDARHEYEHAIGLLERHFLWGRVRRVIRHLDRCDSASPKHKLFVRMTQLEGK